MPETQGAPLVCFSVRNSLRVQEAKEWTRCTLSIELWFQLFFYSCESIVPMLWVRSSYIWFSFSMDSFRSCQSKGRLVCLSKSRWWKVFLPESRSFAVLICQLLLIRSFLHFSVQQRSSLKVCSRLAGQYSWDSRSSFQRRMVKFAAFVRSTSGLYTQFRWALVSLTSCRRKGLGFYLPGTLSKPQMTTASLFQVVGRAGLLILEFKILLSCSLSILYFSISKTLSMLAPPFEKLLLRTIIQQNQQEFATFIRYQSNPLRQTVQMFTGLQYLTLFPGVNRRAFEIFRDQGTFLECGFVQSTIFTFLASESFNPALQIVNYLGLL